MAIHLYYDQYANHQLENTLNNAYEIVLDSEKVPYHNIQEYILDIKISANDLQNSAYFDYLENITREIYLAKNQNQYQVERKIHQDDLGRVSGIILDIDSNGGFCLDSLNLADKINFLKNKFNLDVVSFIKTAYSAGYMMPSLCSDKIYLSKYGEIGHVGMYIYEENFTEIFDQIGLQRIVLSNEDASDLKYHNPFLPLSEEAKIYRKEFLDNSFNNYLHDLSVVRPQIFADFDMDNLNKKSFDYFCHGLNLDSNQAIKLGLADEMGYFEDALEYLTKKRCNEINNCDVQFKIIEISSEKNLSSLNNLNQVSSFLNKDFVLNKLIDKYLEKKLDNT